MTLSPEIAVDSDHLLLRLRNDLIDADLQGSHRRYLTFPSTAAARTAALQAQGSSSGAG